MRPESAVNTSAAPTGDCRERFMINQVPAWSASRGASRGRCPSADDSSESPTQTSGSPKTFIHNNTTALTGLCVTTGDQGILHISRSL